MLNTYRIDYNLKNYWEGEKLTHTQVIASSEAEAEQLFKEFADSTIKEYCDYDFLKAEIVNDSSLDQKYLEKHYQRQIAYIERRKNESKK